MDLILFLERDIEFLNIAVRYNINSKIKIYKKYKIVPCGLG